MGLPKRSRPGTDNVALFGVVDCVTGFGAEGKVPLGAGDTVIGSACRFGPGGGSQLMWAWKTAPGLGTPWVPGM